MKTRSCTVRTYKWSINILLRKKTYAQTNFVGESVSHIPSLFMWDSRSSREVPWDTLPPTPSSYCRSETIYSVIHISCQLGLSHSGQQLKELGHETEFKYIDKKWITLRPNKSPYWFLNFEDEPQKNSRLCYFPCGLEENVQKELYLLEFPAKLLGAALLVFYWFTG